MKEKNKSQKKNGLHSRNLHRKRYDFSVLIQETPELSSFVSPNRYGDESINFADPSAVKMLNRALLKHFYHIEWWDIPDDYLTPPVPGRADYVHNAADLLAFSNGGEIQKGKTVSLLDIGVGANCIYPMIGTATYGWSFTGSDIDQRAIDSCKKIIHNNKLLKDAISLRLQKNHRTIFKGIIQKGERFDLTMCNPPFHATLEHATKGSMRKRENLKLNKEESPLLNFGGKANELCCHGGEESFVANMVKESKLYSRSCLWFTSLISKKNTLTGLYKTLKKVEAANIRTINMCQGNKVSRIIAWTFFSKEEHQEWKKERWG